MPPGTIKTSEERVKPLEQILPDLRAYIAKELSCGERMLAPEEMSLDIIVPHARLPIADTELVILAAPYEERVKKQDQISLNIKHYIQQTCPAAGSVYVWLMLGELGHSSDR